MAREEPVGPVKAPEAALGPVGRAAMAQAVPVVALVQAVDPREPAARVAVEVINDWRNARP